MSTLHEVISAGIGVQRVGAWLFSDGDERRKHHMAQVRAIDARTQRDETYWIQWHRKRPGVSRHVDPLRRPLRLLSLDGGGVRGIVSLIVLEQIMNEVAPGVKPCEWFDLIGGTSTGGLIAIMLGRLRMSIRDCIEAYRELSKEVFDVGALDLGFNFWNGHRFSGDKLRKAIEKVVDEYRGTSSTKMWDNPNRRTEEERVCRTFVVAIPGCDVSRPPKLFRTYNCRFQRHSADQCQIWEAARATSCAPSFFPEIQVDGVYYSDGGLGYNNPAKVVLQEAQSLWGPNQRIGCLLSLGTGSVSSYMTPLSCEGVHEELTSNQLVKPFYYRFNPTMEENIGLEEWKKLEELEKMAADYLDSTSQKVAGFAATMVQWYY
ncbi:hypothetical protein M407DRAFT_25657 [Tulasnella calospora MUT 4182]|uniref:PNPLA domain-containing protein n=1 Tax=Tulasnella calospora MUT 4182 TaxID=1051891 RepID=A0A0C3KU48_9AGAM|nr:hypothetical protein M407DRAFT_25657 [Tulasnella calospora MUT 4182]